MKWEETNKFCTNSDFNVLLQYPDHPLKDGLTAFCALKMGVSEETVRLALDIRLGRIKSEYS